MANKVSEEKKEFARVLYMSGEQQNIIAEKVGVSKQTINRWVAEEAWDKRRAAQSVTRPEIVNNLLRAISNEVEKLNEERDAEKVAGACDKLSKLAATIEKLDKRRASSMQSRCSSVSASGYNTGRPMTRNSPPN